MLTKRVIIEFLAEYKANYLVDIGVYLYQQGPEVVDASIMEHLHHRTAACLQNIANTKDSVNGRGWYLKKLLSADDAFMTAVMESMLGTESWIAVAKEASAKALVIKEEVKAAYPEAYPEPSTEKFTKSEVQLAAQEV